MEGVGIGDNCLTAPPWDVTIQAMMTTATKTRLLAPLLLLLLLTGRLAAVAPPPGEVAQSSVIDLPVVIGRPALSLTPVGEGFTKVTAITHAGDARLFVAELAGVIKVMQPDGHISVFLDITDRVLSTGGEYGLFDLAFHPGYSDPASPGFGFFYVIYTTGWDDGEERDVDYILARFRVGSDANAADAGSETRLLVEGQHSTVHKGGALEFDPRNARLYASLGDDSGYLVAQQEDSYKGKIIRLDVNQVPQAIAGDARVFARPEIVASGLRNPWRIALDAADNRLFIGDVGDGSWEEINLLALDGDDNYGWPCLEGSLVNGDFTEEAACRRPFTPAIYQYAHQAAPVCAVIAGRVYRPPHNPDDGRFIYGDLCSREPHALSLVGDTWQSTPLGTQPEGLFTTFGEAGDGTLYLGSFDDSKPIYRMYIP
ncbi:protein of unknown function [Candidatus Promineifilum breve]|uniref:Glucose/Sorbosone dehydrogenase domain-containing protein n=2 Tax=Candidatus Promineifilum breve TaxID=1806508 RepID=A0A160T933_9CHLR|nr:protein of unknown function [Candidatus Promineifilum breve]